jgi:DNA-binding protein H-NS
MLSLEQLLKQQADLTKQIEETKSRERDGAIEQIRSLMANHGLTAADIGPEKAARKKGSTGKKVAAKYRHPTTGETWSGRGLQPKWLKAALAGGKKKIEDFAV